MNRKALLLTILVVVLLSSGCRKQVENVQPTISTESGSIETSATEMIIEGPGFGLMPEDEDNQEKSPDEPTEGLNENTEEPTTEPTEQPTEHEEYPTESTTEPSEAPTEEPTEPTTEPDSKYCCDYSKYMAMSPAAQEAFMKTFSTPMDFVTWCQNAEMEHNTHDNSIEVEGGEINIGDYIG